MTKIIICAHQQGVDGYDVAATDEEVRATTIERGYAIFRPQKRNCAETSNADARQRTKAKCGHKVGDLRD